jgi:hypothetical protein
VNRPFNLDGSENRTPGGFGLDNGGDDTNIDNLDGFEPPER